MTGERLEGYICPECGSSVINDGYDMDFDVTNCHCSYCEWEGNHKQCMSDDEEDETQSEYIVDGVDTRTGEPVENHTDEDSNEIWIVTFLYNDENGITAYSNVFKSLENAITDALIAQCEFTDGWDEESFDDEHCKEATGIGVFTCIDDDNNSLTITIKRGHIR